MSPSTMDTNSDADLLAGLLRGLARMDDSESLLSPASMHEGLTLRLAYVFLMRPDCLKNTLCSADTSGGNLEATLLALPNVSKYLACLSTVLSVFRELLVDSDVSDVVPCTRTSELCRLPRWQRLDGSDPIELVTCVERATGYCLENCPWWEFPVLEVAQSLYVSSEDYSPVAHRTRIADAMLWRSSARDIWGDEGGRLLAEMICVLWGLSFRDCTPSLDLRSLLSTRSTASPYYSTEHRVTGLSEILGTVLDATGRNRRRIRSRLLSSIKAGGRLEDAWARLRDGVSST